MNNDDEFELDFTRKIKSLSTSDLEKIISDAIGNSVDEEYEVKIKGINYNPELNSDFHDASEITFSISKKFDMSQFGSANKT
jgi:hypothetical protein